MFNIVIELGTRFDDLTDDNTDNLIDAFADYHPALGRGDFGNAELVISLQAENLRQATDLAYALLADRAPAHDVASLSVMPTEEFDRRAGISTLAALGELLSVTEVADRLHVTRQRVLQRIDAGDLPARRVGNTWAIVAAALTGNPTATETLAGRNGPA